jgi:4-amino-4-deoxy-L-arabinose transferase-like glycosyltransferase
LINPSPIHSSNREIIVEPGGPAKQWVYLLAILIAISGITLFYGLGRLALLGPDEPRYAEVAREMLVNNDYISPRLCGCLWFEKPALLYWMAAAAYRLLGVSELAARMPSAISALALMIFLFQTILRRISPAAAFVTCLILITSPLFIGYARAGVPDMLLTAAMSVAFLSVYLAATATSRGRGRARTGYWSLACASAGAAVLAKGLVGIIIFIIVLAAAYAVNPGFRFIRGREVALGTAVFLAVASIWYAPVTARHGQEFIREFFINHHFKRYLTDTYHHPQPVYFFLIILVAGVFPWTFLLIPAIRRIRLSELRRSTPRSLLLSLAWVWLIACLVFFSFSESKLPGYILPAVPALAILIGMEAERFWNGQARSAMPVTTLAGALSMLALGLLFVIFTHAGGFSTEKISFAVQPMVASEAGRIAVWVPLFVAVIALAASIRGKVRWALIIGPAGVLTLVLLCGLFFMAPALSEAFGLKTLSVKAAAELKPGERIAFYIDKEYAPVFYAAGRVICGSGMGDVLDAFSPDDIAAVVKTEGSLVVVTTQNWEKDLENDRRFDTETIGRQRRTTALRVTLRLDP